MVTIRTMWTVRTQTFPHRPGKAAWDSAERSPGPRAATSPDSALQPSGTPARTFLHKALGVTPAAGDVSQHPGHEVGGLSIAREPIEIIGGAGEYGHGPRGARVPASVGQGSEAPYARGAAARAWGTLAA